MVDVPVVIIKRFRPFAILILKCVYLYVLQQQAFAVSEVTLQEDQSDESILFVFLNQKEQAKQHWVRIFKCVYISISFLKIIHFIFWLMNHGKAKMLNNNHSQMYST